jgi:hypothetical protein
MNLLCCVSRLWSRVSRKKKSVEPYMEALGTQLHTLLTLKLVAQGTNLNLIHPYIYVERVVKGHMHTYKQTIFPCQTKPDNRVNHTILVDKFQQSSLLAAVVIIRFHFKSNYISLLPYPARVLSTCGFFFFFLVFTKN